MEELRTSYCKIGHLVCTEFCFKLNKFEEIAGALWCSPVGFIDTDLQKTV